MLTLVSCARSSNDIAAKSLTVLETARARVSLLSIQFFLNQFKSVFDPLHISRQHKKFAEDKGLRWRRIIEYVTQFYFKGLELLTSCNAMDQFFYEWDPIMHMCILYTGEAVPTNGFILVHCNAPTNS